MSCISQSVFCCILHNIAFGGPFPPFQSVTPFMDHGNKFLLVFRRLLMLATQLLHKLMEGMWLTFVHCAARSTPPHFVVNIWKIIGRSVLTHISPGTKLFIRHDTYHICCAKGIRRFGLMPCAV